MQLNDKRVQYDKSYGYFFYHGNQKNKLINKICRACESVFLARPYKTRNGWAVFCSQSCKAKQKRPFSAKEKHWNWKGGRLKDNQGYIQILVGKENGGRYRGYIFEHTMVMEKHLRRKLTKDENIHHKNGKRDDNRLSNLELWSTSQPKGQRVKDKIIWAKQILAKYGEHND